MLRSCSSLTNLTLGKGRWALASTQLLRGARVRGGRGAVEAHSQPRKAAPQPGWWGSGLCAETPSPDGAHRFPSTCRVPRPKHLTEVTHCPQQQPKTGDSPPRSPWRTASSHGCYQPGPDPQVSGHLPTVEGGCCSVLRRRHSGTPADQGAFVGVDDVLS